MVASLSPEAAMPTPIIMSSRINVKADAIAPRITAKKYLKKLLIMVSYLIII